LSPEARPPVSIVVPVYRSARMLEALVTEIEAALAQKVTFEIILVNDGSPDGSWAEIERLAATREHLTGVDLMRNYGQHNAILTGALRARHPVVVTMDDDLQHPPERILDLVDKLADGYDVVYGTAVAEKHQLWRRVAGDVSDWVLSHFMNMEFAQASSAFRAFRSELTRPFQSFRSPHVDVDVLLSWGTVRFGVVPIAHRERKDGASNYTFVKLVTHAINVLLCFSTAPLRLATGVGFAFLVFGAGVFFFVIGRWLKEGSVPGFPFLASLTTLFAGAQLFALGIIGEYLARVHIQLSGRPLSLVRRTTRDS
jgi:glycosyltransferase involved in cell wall biosynthesis